MNTTVQADSLNEISNEIPLSLRLALTDKPVPGVSDSEDYRVHTLEETSTFQTVRALWNGTPVLFQHSDHEVHPDRIVIGRSKGKDYPILICKVYNLLLFEPGIEPSITGFAAFPRPAHARNYEEAGEYSLMGGPADVFLGSVGSIAFNSYKDPEHGKTVQIDWLQGSISPNKVWLSTNHRIISPSITRRYFNWDIKLVKLAFEYFQKNAFEHIHFKGDNLSPKQFQRQSDILKAAAARTGFTKTSVGPASPEDQVPRRSRILEMSK